MRVHERVNEECNELRGVILVGAVDRGCVISGRAVEGTNFFPNPLIDQILVVNITEEEGFSVEKEFSGSVIDDTL
jgi:hypothetical protein